MLDAACMELTCLYCDDVRNEADGRSTILGWYAQDVMNTAGPFPLVVHNLAAVVLLRLPMGSAPTHLKLEMLVGEEVRYAVAPTLQELTEMVADACKSPQTGVGAGATLRFVIKLPNLPIPQPCALQFRATVDGALVAGNALWVNAN